MSDELMRLVKLYERELERLRAFEVSWAAPVWDDERVPVTSTRLGGTKDPGFTVFKTNGAGSQGVFIYWFDADTEEELYFTVQLPHGWKEGTNIHPHVHWVPNDVGGVGLNVRWGLEYTWADLGETFGDTSIIYGSTHSPAENLVLHRHYLTELTAISGTGHTISSMLICRVFRDATGLLDTLDADAGLLEIDFHILIDSNGSREEYVK